MVTWTLSFQPSVSFTLTARRGERVAGTGRVPGRATTAGDAASLLGIPILPFSLGGHCGVDILKDHHESVECVASIELGARGGLCISKAIFSAI